MFCEEGGNKYSVYKNEAIIIHNSTQSKEKGTKMDSNSTKEVSTRYANFNNIDNGTAM